MHIYVYNEKMRRFILTRGRFPLQCSKKSMGGPRPIATVPEMVVAERASRSLKRGKMPTIARKTIANLPATSDLNNTFIHKCQWNE